MTNVKLISDEKLKKKYEVSVPFIDIEKLVEKKAEEKQKTVKLDGFRPGKVPLETVKSKFSAALIAECAEDVVDEEVKKIIEKDNLNLISRPEIDIFEYPTKDVDFKFTASFELFPEIPDIKFEKIQLTKKVVKLSDEDIQKSLDTEVKFKSDWKEQDESYTTKDGDKVKINFLGKIDGVPFEGGEAKNYELQLGSKSFIDNFEEQLIGKKIGDKVEVQVKFPEEYGKKELSGKPATFDVEILGIKTPEPIELTDENAKEHFGVENIEELRNSIKDQLIKTYETMSMNQMKSQIFDWITGNVKINLPEKLVDEEYNRQWKSLENELEGKDEKEKEKEKKELRKSAEDSIKIGLVFSEIGKNNNIKIDNTEIVEHIRKIASAYPGVEQTFIDFYSKNKQFLNELTGRLLEEKIVNFIISKANVKEESVSSKEFIDNYKAQ